VSALCDAAVATGEETSMVPGTHTVRRTAQQASGWRVDADVCVVGAGIAGTSAALEAAGLGRRVALIDSLPMLGGQAVHSIIGTFVGLFSNGPNRHQLTHGIADAILRDLGEQGAVHYNDGPMTTTVYYDEVALQRWIVEKVREADITVLVGAILREAHTEGSRVTELELATRFGDVRVRATGFVDASGDAALAWMAGLPCREPDAPIYGTQIVVLENVHPEHEPDREEFQALLRERAQQYGLVRTAGLVFVFPSRGTGVVNMTHVETPLEPVAASRVALEGRAQADRAVELLRAEFPECFGDATIRSYGLPGIRQTRWIEGRHHLTADELRAAVRFPDAVARCSWPIELHDREEGYLWEPFPDDHVHTVPLASMTPAGADNVVAAGRCIDGDAAALSSVRVMGPCIAMGAGAAHALDLAGVGSVHEIDHRALRERCRENLERVD
jgi:2-polyprenyl-6-methoxyphenol hydroxylase-like FAD-dependent oxidoreductase